MSRIFTAFVLLCALVPAYAVAQEAPHLTSVDVSDATCKISWEATAPTAGGYNVYMRENSGRYLQLNDKPIEESYVRLTSMVNGIPYHFAVTAVDGDGAESTAATTGMVVPVGYSTKILSLKGGAKAADYHIFSTPLVTGPQSVEDFFAYLPAYDKNMWRIFSLEREGWREFRDIKNIAPGKAYWFLSRYDTDIFISGETVDNYKPFHIQLHPGWNMISSPFLYPVSWEEVLRKNPEYEQFLNRAIWEFSDGGFKSAAILKPFGGYYVYNASGKDVEILVPPSPVLPRVHGEARRNYFSDYGAATRHSNGGWMMKISAYDGTYHDADNVMGIDARAYKPAYSDEAGLANMAEPPAWPQHLSLYFAPDYGHGPKRSSDIRESGGAWKVIVEGGENSRVVVKWKTLSGSRNAVLLDIAANQSIDMGKNGSYSFSRNGTGPRELFISVD